MTLQQATMIAAAKARQLRYMFRFRWQQNSCFDGGEVDANRADPLAVPSMPNWLPGSGDRRDDVMLTESP